MTTLLNNTRRHDVAFHRDGRIDITAHIAKQLNMQAGDVIDIAKGQGEFLLYIKHKAETVIGRHEAQCYKTNKSCRVSNNLRAYSTRLTAQVLALCSATDTARLNAGQPFKHPLLGITAPIIIRKMSV